jgi:hypothetical protein
MTTHRLADDLAFEFTLMLTIGAVLGAVAVGGGVMLFRRQRSGRRTWAWRGADRPRPLHWLMRSAGPLAVFAGAAVWWLYPVRVTLASISPVRTHLVTVALLALFLTVVAAATTRRTRQLPLPAEPLRAMATA